MKFSIVFLMACSLLANAISTANAQPEKQSSSGIAFYVVRVIYPAAKKQGVTLTAHNKSSASYLMQAGIRPVDLNTGDANMNWQGKPLMPFIVTPPLARLEANNELVLRIRRNDALLPDDRESVFFISLRALPAQHADGRQMVMTTVTNIKLFYRPTQLATQGVANAAPKLTFSQEGAKLTAHNPTPYWLTFSRLSVGKTTLEKAALRRMVPPFSQQSYILPSPLAGKITWQLIDEDGWDTPVAQQD